MSNLTEREIRQIRAIFDSDKEGNSLVSDPEPESVGWDNGSDEDVLEVSQMDANNNIHFLSDVAGESLSKVELVDESPREAVNPMYVAPAQSSLQGLQDGVVGEVMVPSRIDVQIKDEVVCEVPASEVAQPRVAKLKVLGSGGSQVIVQHLNPKFGVCLKDNLLGALLDRVTDIELDDKGLWGSYIYLEKLLTGSPPSPTIGPPPSPTQLDKEQALTGTHPQPAGLKKQLQLKEPIPESEVVSSGSGQSGHGTWSLEALFGAISKLLKKAYVMVPPLTGEDIASSTRTEVHDYVHLQWHEGKVQEPLPKRVKSAKSFTCNKCSMIFPSYNERHHHHLHGCESIQHVKLYMCSLCSQAFESTEGRHRHYLQHLGRDFSKSILLKSATDRNGVSGSGEGPFTLEEE